MNRELILKRLLELRLEMQELVREIEEFGQWHRPTLKAQHLQIKRIERIEEIKNRIKDIGSTLG